MLGDVNSPGDLRPGDIYEDCAYHPCLCLFVDGDEVRGVSLVDGSYPRGCSIGFCGVRKLTLEEAWEWKTRGPADEELGPARRWWKSQGHEVLNLNDKG